LPQQQKDDGTVDKAFHGCMLGAADGEKYLEQKCKEGNQKACEALKFCQTNRR